MTSASDIDAARSGSPAGGDMNSVRITVQAIVMVVIAVRCVMAMLVPGLRQPGWPDVLVGLVAAAAIVFLATTRRPTRARGWAAVAVTAFWGSTTFSALLHGQGIPVASVAMALVAAALILGPPLSPWPLRISVLTGAVVAVLSLVAGLLGLLGVVKGPLYGTAVYQRETLGLPALSGIAGHPNTLAQILGLALLIAAAIALANRRIGAVILPLVILLPLLWTQSRTSVAAAVACVVLLLLQIRWPAMRPYVVGGALVAAVLPPMVHFAMGRVLDVNSVFNGRPIAWDTGRFVVSLSPITGSGPEVMSEDFWEVLGRSRTDGAGWLPLHAHNEVIETIAQSGVVGIVTLHGVVLVGVTAALQRSGSNAALAAATLVFLGLQAGVEVPLGLTYFPIGFLLPAMAVAVLAYGGPLEWRQLRSEPG